MLASPPAAEMLSSPPGRRVLVWATIAVLAGAFYCIEHNAQVSTLKAFTVTGDEMAERAATGDAMRRLAVAAIALFGAALLIRRSGWPLEIHSLTAWLALAYLAWCGMTILWSDDPSLTLRHFGVLLFCGIGALGIARQLALNDLCLVTLGVTAILIANGVRTEIALGTFQPLSSEYRFAGTLHPNLQASYCATMALSAAFVASHVKRGRTLAWLLCAAGVVLLLLTKSRTVCAAFLAGLLAYGWLTVSPRNKAMVVATAVSLGCALGLAAALLGSDLERSFANAALLGRPDEADSLSGRVPLWTELVPHVGQRLLLGHGYLTFWSPQRIESFSSVYQWTVPDGHCAYLDMLLDLGVIGGALCVATVVLCIREVRSRVLAGGGYGYGFLFALLACRALNACLESSVMTPTSCVPFLMVCCLLHVVFCRCPDRFPSPESPTQEAPR